MKIILMISAMEIQGKRQVKMICCTQTLCTVLSPSQSVKVRDGACNPLRGVAAVKLTVNTMVFGGAQCQLVGRAVDPEAPEAPEAPGILVKLSKDRAKKKRSWLKESLWRLLEQRPLRGPVQPRRLQTSAGLSRVEQGQFPPQR